MIISTPNQQLKYAQLRILILPFYVFMMYICIIHSSPNEFLENF